jgi:hypothetical protein
MLKRYLIERELPNIGSSSEENYKKIVGTSNEVLENLGPDIKWEQSFVTDNKVFCVYEAANEELIKKHAELGGFPANKISEIKETLSPDFGQQLYKGKENNSGVNVNLS